jgi:hypothetical protein
MTPPDPFRKPGQPDAAAGRSALAEYERLRQLLPRDDRWLDRRIIEALPILAGDLVAAAAAANACLVLFVLAGWTGPLAVVLATILAAIGAAGGVRALRALPPAEVRAWRAQGRAERNTAAVLDRLRAAGYHTLHDRELPGAGQLDHVVVGPTGLFIIETRVLPAGIRVHNGVLSHRGVTLHELARELWAQTLQILDTIGAELGRSDLRAWTVLAIHGSRLPAGVHAADNVALVEHATLVDYITSRPYVLAPLAVAAIAGATDAALPPAITR